METKQSIDFIIDNGYFSALIWTWIGLGVITFAYLFYRPAPYGRHQEAGWGPNIPSWLGWIIMESPSPLLILLCFYQYPPAFSQIGSWVLFSLWLVHYIHRALIQPLTNPGGNKPMALVICISAIFFNLVNGYVNGRGLTAISENYGKAWLTAPTTIIGLLLFGTGFVINRQADAVLLSLRKPGETGYKIPYGEQCHMQDLSQRVNGFLICRVPKNSPKDLSIHLPRGQKTSTSLASLSS